jgi:hypothetical protein
MAVVLEIKKREKTENVGYNINSARFSYYGENKVEITRGEKESKIKKIRQYFCGKTSAEGVI